jgi:hypothetical protein
MTKSKNRCDSVLKGVSDFGFGVNLFFSLNRKRETENATRDACGFASIFFRHSSFVLSHSYFVSLASLRSLSRVDLPIRSRR